MEPPPPRRRSLGNSRFQYPGQAQVVPSLEAAVTTAPVPTPAHLAPLTTRAAAAAAAAAATAAPTGHAAFTSTSASAMRNTSAGATALPQRASPSKFVRMTNSHPSHPGAGSDDPAARRALSLAERSDSSKDAELSPQSRHAADKACSPTDAGEINAWMSFLSQHTIDDEDDDANGRAAAAAAAAAVAAGAAGSTSTTTRRGPSPPPKRRLLNDVATAPSPASLAAGSTSATTTASAAGAAAAVGATSAPNNVDVGVTRAGSVISVDSRTNGSVATSAGSMSMQGDNSSHGISSDLQKLKEDNDRLRHQLQDSLKKVGEAHNLRLKLESTEKAHQHDIERLRQTHSADIAQREQDARALQKQIEAMGTRLTFLQGDLENQDVARARHDRVFASRTLCPDSQPSQMPAPARSTTHQASFDMDFPGRPSSHRSPYPRGGGAGGLRAGAGITSPRDAHPVRSMTDQRMSPAAATASRSDACARMQADSLLQRLLAPAPSSPSEPRALLSLVAAVQANPECLARHPMLCSQLSHALRLLASAQDNQGCSLFRALHSFLTTEVAVLGQAGVMAVDFAAVRHALDVIACLWPSLQPPLIPPRAGLTVCSSPSGSMPSREESDASAGDALDDARAVLVASITQLLGTDVVVVAPVHGWRIIASSLQILTMAAGRSKDRSVFAAVLSQCSFHRSLQPDTDSSIVLQSLEMLQQISKAPFFAQQFQPMLFGAGCAGGFDLCCALARCLMVHLPGREDDGQHIRGAALRVFSLLSSQGPGKLGLTGPQQEALVLAVSALLEIELDAVEEYCDMAAYCRSSSFGLLQAAAVYFLALGDGFAPGVLWRLQSVGARLHALARERQVVAMAPEWAQDCQHTLTILLARHNRQEQQHQQQHQQPQQQQ